MLSFLDSVGQLWDPSPKVASTGGLTVRRLIMISALAMLAACNDAAEDAAPAEADATTVDLAAETGGAIVTLADGTQILSYSTADGKTFGAPLAADYKTSRWSAEDGKGCIAPPDEEKFCFTNSTADANGTVTATGDDGVIATFVSLSAPYAAGATAAPGPGAYLVTPAEGKPFLSVWTEDGTEYSAEDPQEGTWRAVDGKRCGMAPGETEESCSTPGEIGDDGTFEAVSDDGDKVTVRLLD